MAFEQERLLSTSEAAELLGLAPSSVAGQCRRGVIPGTLQDGHWRIPESVVRAYNARPAPHRRRAIPAAETVRRTLEVLAELGDATAEEVAVVLERHEGNVRKYLSILRLRGLAERCGDGIYRATPAGQRELHSGDLAQAS